MWVQCFTLFIFPFHCPPTPRSPSEADQLIPIYSWGSPGSQKGSDKVRVRGRATVGVQASCF